MKIGERIMRHTGYFSTPEEVDMGNQIVPRPDKYYLFLEMSWVSITAGFGYWRL